MAKSKIATFASKRPPYFWWVLGHALAACLCALSWILSLQIFNHPERQQNYAILKDHRIHLTSLGFLMLDSLEQMNILHFNIFAAEMGF